MKYSVVLISAFAAIATAQAGLSQCGQTCFNNMLALAPSLGCPSADAACLCHNVNFGYGIHDCAYQACGADDAVTIIAYGVQYCQNAAASPIPTGSAATETISATGIVTASDAPGTLSILPISTDATTAVPSTTGVSVPGSSAVATSGSATLATTVGSSTISGAVRASTTAPLSSTSAAGGAKQTAAAGFMAIAGLAALVL